MDSEDLALPVELNHALYCLMLAHPDCHFAAVEMTTFGCQCWAGLEGDFRADRAGPSSK